jgi:hypothetical protein
MILKPFVLSIILAVLTSLLGLIFLVPLTSPQSIALFFLFCLLEVLIILTLSGKSIFLRISLSINKIVWSALLSAISVVLFIFQAAHIYVQLLNAVLYLIVFIFVLGFSILSILRFMSNLSRLEFLALAYPISVSVLAIFGTTALILPASMRGIVESFAIMVLSIIALIINFVRKREDVSSRGITLNNSMLLLVTALFLFVVIFVGLYPQISRLLGLDIARNFLQALSFAKDNLTSSASPNALYPLFGVFQSSVFYVDKPSLETFQIVSITLNLFTILSFYVMASQYLKKYGDYTAAIATIIWSTFAGFGWIAFLSTNFGSSNTSFFALIGQSDLLSYGDITWRRLFFYLAMEATFALVFAALYLLKRKDLSRFKQTLLMAILIIPIPLMHPYATYLLLPTLLCFTIVCSKGWSGQLKSAGYSIVISAFAQFPLTWILAIKGLNLTFSFLTFSEYFILGLIMITLTSVSLPSIRWKFFSERFSTVFRRLLIPIFLLLILAILLSWLSGGVSFNFNNLDLFGYVPLFIFPVKIGIAGVLAVIVIYFLLLDPKYRSKDIIAILLSLVLIITLSIFVEMLQMQYVSTFTFNSNSASSTIIQNNILSFRAERMFEIFKIPLSIVASIALSQLFIATFKWNKKKVNFLVVSCLVPLILIAGMASTLLGFSYYSNVISTNLVSTQELNMLSNLQNNLSTLGKATIISPQTPASYIDFTRATAIVTESTAAWESKSPELPLFVTRQSQNTPTFIYLNKDRDFPALNNYEGNYLAHISKLTSTYLENDEVQVNEINGTSIPIPNSNTALIIPYDQSTMSIVVPLIQQEKNQYMIASLFFNTSLHSLDFGGGSTSFNNVQESNETAVFNGVNSFISISGTQRSTNKLLIEFSYRPLNINTNQVLISKFDWGNSQKSWEVAQYGDKIVFKISPDGINEEVLSTPDMLQLGGQYTVKCEYDGESINTFVNNKLLATMSYRGGIFKGNAEIIIGAELYKEIPTSFSKMQLNDIKILNGIPQVIEPISCAYDLLSSMQLNYTTVVSCDNTMSKYKTIILPYDNLTTKNTLEHIENSQNNISNVVILNTSGYGPLLDVFGKQTSETFTANSVIANQNSQRQPSIEVPKIALSAKTRVTAQYVNGSLSSPLVMTVTQGKLSLIYVNIYPFLSQDNLLNPTLTKALAGVLSNCIGLYDESSITPWFTVPSLLFTNLQANGTINVSSDAIASMELPENQTTNLKSYNSVFIKSTEITVQGGYGFYTSLTAFNPAISLLGNQTVTINVNGNVTIFLRQPEISVNGTIQFQDFYMLHPSPISTDGRITTLKGNMTLDVYVSDEYSIVLPYKFSSSITVKYATPLMQFNEVASLLQLIPYVIPISILVIAFFLIRKRFSSLVVSTTIQKDIDD